MNWVILILTIPLFSQIRSKENPCKSDSNIVNGEKPLFKNTANSDECDLCISRLDEIAHSCKLYECSELDCSNPSVDIRKCCVKKNCSMARKDRDNTIGIEFRTDKETETPELTEREISPPLSKLISPNENFEIQDDFSGKSKFEINMEKQIYQRNDQVMLKVLPFDESEKINSEVQSCHKRFTSQGSPDLQKLNVIEFVSEFEKMCPQEYEIIKNAAKEGVNYICENTGISSNAIVTCITGFGFFVVSIVIGIYNYIKKKNKETKKDKINKSEELKSTSGKMED